MQILILNIGIPIILKFFYYNMHLKIIKKILMLYFFINIFMFVFIKFHCNKFY